MITLLKTFLPDAGLDGKMSFMFYLNFLLAGMQWHLIT